MSEDATQTPEVAAPTSSKAVGDEPAMGSLVDKSPEAQSQGNGLSPAIESSLASLVHNSEAQRGGVPGAFPTRRKDSVSSRHTGIEPLESAPKTLLFPEIKDDLRHSFVGPSSAPPTPSVISVTHPPQFIHTHHPRRGSLTPLGLNVISPVAPPQVQHSIDAASVASSPMRSIGFSALNNEYSLDHSRRDSVASVGSNLTATRPSYASSLGGGKRRSSLTPSLPNLAPPANFNSSKRRSSLTPSLPTLAAPSPTRALVTARLSTHTNTEGTIPPQHARTMEYAQGSRRGSAAAAVADARRGSLPHLYYGAWTGPSGDKLTATPLASARGSLAAHIDEGFKFGSPPEAPQASSSRGTDSNDESRIAALSLLKPRNGMSAFELTEQEEADRQRRAFLAATYGEDSRRARARLSLGGHSATPSSPASTRRQSLLVWERVQKPETPPAVAGHFPQFPSPPSISNVQLTRDGGLGRRPSLPVSIPGRTPQSQTIPSFEDQNVWDNPDSLPYDDTPMRPLPPLMPLSDPVPRLLPATLALHRATHLLNSRNLASAPLPAPLPPSLHPPAPVDLSEFDIDFILAGSKTNLGREGSTGSNKRKSLANSFDSGPSARLAPSEEEDSFAKFVGAFDDEYGGRRGEWTFRMCKPSSSRSDPFPMHDMVDPLSQVVTRPRAERDAPGAGRFEIMPNGDVRSVESGTIWHIRRTTTREYELETPIKPRAMVVESINVPNAPQPLVLSPTLAYTLASKMVHTENGGVKLPFNVHRELSSRGSRVSRRFAAASRNRQSISEAPEVERKDRINSQDSGATAVPIPRATPHSPPNLSPPKEEKEEKFNRRSKKDDDDKKKSSFGGVLKRSLFKASSLAKDYEDRRKIHGNLWGTNGAQNLSSSLSSKPPLRASPSDRSDSASASSQQSSRYMTDSTLEEDWLADDVQFGSLGLGIEDEQNGGLPWKEGKAWEGVPDEALAMVIPIESEKGLPPPPPHTPAATQPFINPFFVDGPRQALLVWFTPFNAAPHEARTGSNSTLFRITESPAHETLEGHNQSALRLPKLLRPRGSRHEIPVLSDAKHISIPPPPTTPPSEWHDFVPILGNRNHNESGNFQPLPFKSFRVVAKVVDVENLRSEPEVPVIALEQWTEQMRTGKPVGLHTPPLETTATMPEHELLSATSVSSDTVMSGRAFPTVIAVCHSPSSGVEFVLEGLDRLGLCKGESAWGPTGYEEWRGTGLSENGRQTIDLLWAATSAIMGL